MLQAPGRGAVLDYTRNDAWAAGMLFHGMLSRDEAHSPFPGESQRAFRDAQYRDVDTAAEHR